MSADGERPANRPITWRRAVDVALRTMHIAAAGVLVGGHVFGVDACDLAVALYATIGSGAGLIVTEVWHSRHWPYQVRGLLVLLKLGIMCLVFAWWDARVGILLCVLAVGAIGSHVPRLYRHYSIVHGRVVD